MNLPKRGCGVGLKSAVCCVLGSMVLSALTGCVQEPAPFDPREARSWMTDHEHEVKATPLYPVPTTAEAPFLPDSAVQKPEPKDATYSVPLGPPAPMSLQEVIHRTVTNNLDIRVASYDTAIDQTRVMEAIANFDPSFFSDVSFTRVDKGTPGVDSAVLNPSQTGFISEVTRLDQESISTFDVGIRQNLESGGKIEVKQTVTDNYFFPVRGLLNPYYQNDLTLELTQPLLQNFGVDVNRARITIAQNNQRISLLDFRDKIETTLLKCEQTYWQLVQAQRDVAAVTELIDESDHLVNILKRRGILDVNAIPLQQAIAETAARKVQLILLQQHVIDLSTQLKQFMNDAKYPVSGSAQILATDTGADQPLHFNLDDQIDTAVNNRLELGQQQERVDSADIALKVAINNLLPQLNLQVTGDVDGLASSLSTSLNSEGQFNRLGYSVGLQLVIPIGNRAARAVWERSILQRLQAIISYKNLLEQVTVDVDIAANGVNSSWIRLREARRSTLYYRELVNNQKKLDESGDQPITSDSVFIHLQNQQFLATAEQTEDQALNDYAFAIANLEKAKGTILRYNNVIMEQAQFPAGKSN